MTLEKDLEEYIYIFICRKNLMFSIPRFRREDSEPGINFLTFEVEAYLESLWLETRWNEKAAIKRDKHINV